MSHLTTFQCINSYDVWYYNEMFDTVSQLIIMLFYLYAKSHRLTAIFFIIAHLVIARLPAYSVAYQIVSTLTKVCHVRPAMASVA